MGAEHSAFLSFPFLLVCLVLFCLSVFFSFFIHLFFACLQRFGLRCGSQTCLVLLFDGERNWWGGLCRIDGIIKWIFEVE